MDRKKIDLTGHRFGRLTAKNYFEKNGSTFVNCECDCGNKNVVRIDKLKSGYTKSCGCFRTDTAKQFSSFLIEERKKVSKEGTNLLRLNSKIPSNNTSGTKGVFWTKKTNKWGAEIGFKGKKIRLGYFKNKQDAINARKEAEEKYFQPILEKYGKEDKQ